MGSLLIKGGQVLSPEDGLEGHFDILIRDGVIQEITAQPEHPADETLDARGQVVAPGLVDLHVHLREPGGEESETVGTGLAAAVAGGFTAVCAMPNTKPVNDQPDLTRDLIAKANRLALARVFPVPAVSMASQGDSLTDFPALHEAGAVMFTDDGRPVKTAGLMRRALSAAREIGVPIADHCEEPSLSTGGVINEGPIAERLGVKGIPSVAEDICLGRDLLLAEETGAHLHVMHVSTARGVEMIRAAKRRGVRVTCEVTPHHFTLTEEAVVDRGPDAKMNPPLRSALDRESLWAGIADGTIDAIASDHAPHAAEFKRGLLPEAAFGVIGLESALALAITQLVHTGKISLGHLVVLMSSNPARIINQPLGRLRVGNVGDITVFDPNLEWTYSAAAGRSKSRNTPFDGWKLKGAVTATVVRGRIAYRRM